MTEIGARIMPYPTPKGHPADKEGSPTVSDRLCNGPGEGSRSHGNISFSVFYGTTLLRVERQNRGGGDRDEGLPAPLREAVLLLPYAL
jgi:hypothetical protein